MTRRRWVAVVQAFAGALCLSFVPIYVRSTASAIHPFVFNAASWTGHGIAFLLFVLMGTKRGFGADATAGSVLAQALPPRPDASVRPLLARLCQVRGQPSIRSGTRSRWLTRPMVWMVTASTNYALFFWSTRYVDVAVSAALYELWPLALVVTLARCDYPRAGSARREITLQKKALMVVAFFGLVLVILGQSGVTAGALSEFLPLGLFGALIALLSAALAGAYPALSIVYGDALHCEHMRSAKRPDRTTSQETDIDERENLWFTAVGITASSLMAVPVNVAISVVGSGSEAFDPGGRQLLMGLIHGFLLGCVVVASGTLFVRLANLNSDDLGVNAILYATPVLALAWLAIAGISLPRIDLFLAGAALVLASNVMIQSRQEIGP